MGQLLAAFQVALSMILVAGAALFLRTLGNLYTAGAGFHADQIALILVHLPDPTYREAPRAFSRLETALIRAEKRWRGGLGGDEKRARSELDVVPELQREVQDLRSAKRPQPRSLAQEIARGAVPNKDILAVLQADLLKPDESKPPPKDPDDTKDPKDPKDPKEPKEPKPPAPAPPKEGEKKKTPQELANLAGGVYAVQHNRTAASVLNLPLAAPNRFRTSPVNWGPAS